MKRRIAIVTGSLTAVTALTAAAPAVGLDPQAVGNIMLCGVCALLPSIFGTASGLHHPIEIPPPPDLLPAEPSSAPAPESRVSRLPVHSATTQHVVFDEHGATVPFHRLGDHYGYPAPDFDLAGFAVRNAGAVEIRGRMIRLHPERASPAAITAAVSHLGMLPAGPVHVAAYASGGWRLDLLPSPDAAADALLGVAGLAKPPECTAFHADALALDEVGGTLGEAFRTWRDAAGEFSAGVLDRLNQIGAWDRALTLHPRRDAIRFAYIGPGITAFGDDWRRERIGQPADGPPDPAYTSSVCALYRRALSAEAPLANRISTTILPTDGAPVLHLDYAQLLLPWTLHDGNTRRSLLTSITHRVADPMHLGYAGPATA